MDTVLGLSVTATNVQTVLVEGCGGDGATLGHDEFDVFAGDGFGMRASEQVAEAVLSIAASDGHRLHAIGVTWSADADLEASLLLDSLADKGLANVVAVQSPRAAEALARSIGRMIGYQRTAVCILEPGAAILSLVDTDSGEIDTLISHAIDSDEQLTAWIQAGLERRHWRPEGLFLVGSVGDLDTLAGLLQDELGLPVFDPPEAELALAHGAALASAADPNSTGPTGAVATGRWPAVPLTMLVAGAVTFVVAVSLAVSPHLIPQGEAHRDAAVATKPSENIGKAPIKPPAPKVAPKAQVPPPQAPPPEAPLPEAVAPPPAQPPPPPPAAPVEPPPPVAEPIPTFEAVEPVAPPAQVVQPINPIQAPPPPPPVVAPAVPPVPEKPRLRDRIIDKIPGLNRFN